jgi:bla regulator protein BlaR1
MIRINFISFLTNSFVISAFILVILGIKKAFKGHITAKWQNNTNLLFLVILSVPFIPSRIFDYRVLNNFLLHKINKEQTAGVKIAENGANITFGHASEWFQDFGVSADRFLPDYLVFFLMGVWVTGIIIFIVFITLGNRRLMIIKRSVAFTDNKVKELFRQCSSLLKIKKSPLMGVSPLLHVPVTMGVLRPCIILPESTLKQFSEKDIKYIFLHELCHYKSRDVLINWVMLMFQTIYWFNPLIWVIFRQMRIDREIACDASVLKVLDKDYFKDYGYTIINFITKLSETPHMLMTASLGGSKSELRKRIKKIAVYTKETKQMKIKSFLIFIFLSCFLLSQISGITQITYTDKYYFHGENVVYEDLKMYFSGFDGSFVMYNMKNDSYLIYNKDKSTARVSPDSTYKIYSALIGLEQGIIKKDNSVLKWDGKENPYHEWNQDQTLESALKNSVNWYFQEIDKKTGKKHLYSYYKKISYGNYSVNGDITDYWMESSLRISPLEQIMLLKKLYKEELDFNSENIRKVKNALRLSENNGSVLSGKTGTGTVNGKNINGWFVGFVEKEDNVFLFAVNIQGKDNAGGKVAAQTALNILRAKNIY